MYPGGCHSLQSCCFSQKLKGGFDSHTFPQNSMKPKKYKFVILILIIFNCLNSQSMYLDKNEKRVVYSLAGNYHKFNTQEYSSYSFGLSYVKNANHEFELLYTKDSDDVKTIDSYYKYYIKNNPYFNIFIGANHIYDLDNNDNSNYGYDYGYYFKIKFGDLIYYPFFSRTEIENNEESQTFPPYFRL